MLSIVGERESAHAKLEARTYIRHYGMDSMDSVGYIYLDYGNFKLTNQVARNAGSIFHSHLVSGIYSWPLAPSTGIYLHACC